MLILFYPDNIKHHSKIRYLLDHLGIETTNDPAVLWDVAIWWDYKTTRQIPHELTADLRPVINLQCHTADKIHVELVFEAIFGRTSLVELGEHIGFCVKKSLEQAVHDGEIVPIPEDPEEGFIYQKLIDTRCAEDLMYDIRVPVIGGVIPLAWRKFRTMDNTFGQAHGKMSRVMLHADVDDILTESEQLQIIEYCALFPVEYCELDILRNNSDGLIYIVDMNNTPGDSLMFHMSKSDQKKSIKLLSAALKNFINTLFP